MMKNKLLHNNDFIRVFVLLKRITEDFVSKVADSGGGFAWGEHAFNYIICRKGNDIQDILRCRVCYDKLAEVGSRLGQFVSKI